MSMPEELRKERNLVYNAVADMKGECITAQEVADKTGLNINDTYTILRMFMWEGAIDESAIERDERVKTCYKISRIMMS